MANVLVITHGTGGDVIPFIRLGKILKNAGYNVFIFTHCIYEEESKKSGLNFVAIDDYEEYKEKNDSLYQLSDPINKLDEYLEFNKKYCGADRMYKEYMLIREYCIDENTIILFRHRFSLSGLLVAEKYNCIGVPVFLAPNYLQHLELHEKLIGETMVNEINIVRSRTGLKNISSWTKWMCSPRFKIAVWPRWYAIEETKDINEIATIGFLAEDTNDQYKISEKVKKFLNSGKKTVLITAGTSNVINPDFYKIAVEACTKENINAILVTPFDELVPKNLEGNILRLHKAPIKDIMLYVYAVIHHGGIGTGSEAIACGIPQIIMPHIADGPDNADKLRKLGVAKVLPMKNWNAESLGKILNNITEDNISLSCKKLSEKMKKDNYKEELCSSIKKLLENKEAYKIKNFPEGSLEESKYLNNTGINYCKEKINEDGVVCNNKSNMDSISERKKKMLLELLRKKQKD
ncbi:glycosyltransferase [Clostridium cellulovorans]|uniref:Glycosyl transferase family 28 n=2 Tax=Clostridium cellulovorans TaxID=1493 RepID=D9SRX7_CLOC7|nr:nucleotide disphospho-sugar-binding domain-containing protein [Clostridium cellulovorans]ADL50494.1 glycosyl transferase family 28 [Clostridium cellulovorans 743B]BAV13180.1 glycosyl transferase related to UDP-glucuronosyltransferase [Clostridium cellulovorans]